MAGTVAALSVVAVLSARAMQLAIPAAHFATHPAICTVQRSISLSPRSAARISGITYRPLTLPADRPTFAVSRALRTLDPAINSNLSIRVSVSSISTGIVVLVTWKDVLYAQGVNLRDPCRDRYFTCSGYGRF